MPDAILDLRPTALDIRYYLRDTQDIPFSFENVNLTGYTVRFTVRRTKTSANFLFQKVISGAGIAVTLDPLASVVTVPVTADDQAHLEEGKFFYDMEFEAPSGKKKTWLAGIFEVFQDIT